jgi:hypothetical protein
MKFSQLSRGVTFRLVPDDGKIYVRLPPSLQGRPLNAKSGENFYNFAPEQLVQILDNSPRDKSDGAS